MSLRRAMVAGVAALAALALTTPAPAATLPPNFQETNVFTGLTNPTSVAFAPDGRVFVAEKNGRIKTFDSLSDASATIAVDLSTNTYNFWDRGMLGMALHPNYPTTPYLYVLYTYDKDPSSPTVPRWGTPGVLSDPCPSPPGPTADGCVVSGRLSRVPLSNGIASGPEEPLIADWCQQYPSHSIGSMAFGSDGALYVSAGDGASFNFVDYGQDGNPVNPCGDPPGGPGTNLTPPTAEGGALRSQDLRTTSDPTSLNGTVLRLDPATGAHMPGNPLQFSSDPNARRIVADGLRNPFRLAVRPGTNDVWLGDVGWNNWEEINRLGNVTDSVVDNFGWPCYEGNGRQPGYDGANLNICENLYAAGSGAVAAPYFTYNHSAKVVAGESCPSGGSSIAGMAFYTGGPYPPEYDGALFFADYSRDCIWAIPAGANGLPDPAARFTFAPGASNPTDIRIGPGGDVFYPDFDAGTIRRISFPTANQPPTAVIAASPISGPAPLTVNFDGTGSSDPDPGDTITYAWDLDGDGAFDDSTAARPSHTYTQGGNVTVRLRVTDNHGDSGTDSEVISVDNTAPTATITAPAAGTTWAAGDVIAFSGSGSDPEQGQLPPSALSWSLLLQHCPSNCHTHPLQDFPGVASGSFSAPDHEYPSHLELRLTVTDSGGLQDTETLQLDPRTVDLTFRSVPTGLQIAVGSSTQATPFTRTVIVGSTNSVSAISPQTSSGTTYAFSSWSDGGAQTHTVVAPATAAAYTATYAAVPAASGLKAAYGFNESSGAGVTDVSGNGNNGTISGATRTTAGRYGGALSFDGVNDWVTVPDSTTLDLTSGMTLEAWVFPTAVTSWRTVLLKEQPGQLVYAIYANNSGNRPSGHVYVGGEREVRGTARLTANVWTHLAATYDGSVLRLFVNGTQVSTLAVSGPIATSALPLRIGGNNVWSEWFAGRIDEVRVYDRALTAAQIQTDMATAVDVDSQAPSAPTNLVAAGGLGQASLSWTAAQDNVGVLRYNVHRSTASGFTPSAANRIAQPTGTTYTDGGLAAGTYFYKVTAEDAAGNVGPPSNEDSATVTVDTTPPAVALTAPADGATVSGTVTVSADASDAGGVAGVQFTLDGANLGSEDTTSPYSVSWNTAAVPNGPHTLRAVARDGTGNSQTSEPVGVTVANAAPTGLVAAYGFDEGSGTTAADASGKGNGGTLAGPTWGAGKYGGALSFDGVNDWVTVADSSSLDLTTGMTLEAWVNPSALTGSWRTVAIKETAGFFVYGLYANADTTPSGHIVIGGTDFDTRGTAALPLGTWTHLAATYDGSALRLYVNGAQVSSRAVTGSMTASTGPLRIGGNNVWSEWFAGRIDELRVYDRALTAAQIQADMATPVSG